MTRVKAKRSGRQGPSPAVACSVLAVCAGSAVAAAAAPSALTVGAPWMRVVGGPRPAAAYFTLSNSSDRPEVLVGASSSDCAALTMHQSRNVNGIESMAMVARRTVPPHGRVDFAPGGYHLMCMSPSKAVRPGAQVPVVLRFADGRRLSVRFPVRPLGAGPR